MLSLLGCALIALLGTTYAMHGRTVRETSRLPHWHFEYSLKLQDERFVPRETAIPMQVWA